MDPRCRDGGKPRPVFREELPRRSQLLTVDIASDSSVRELQLPVNDSFTVLIDTEHFLLWKENRFACISAHL